jgi:hypothetical protein
MGCENIIKVFFHMTNTIKLYHWQTTNYARHKATDSLHSQLLELIDTFIEVYIGRYQRPKYNATIKINVEELTDDSAITIINEYITYLNSDLPKYLKSSDTDLLNIRDEMLQNLNQTLYLFTLK